LKNKFNSENQESLSRTERLIGLARAGDGEALGELLSNYRTYIVFLARTQLHRHMQQKVDPSDIAQDVFMAAHRNVAEFLGQSAEEFAAWLRGILSNILSMHLRKYLGTQKRDLRMERQLDQSLANASGFLQSNVASNVTSPSQHFARNEAFLQLAAALEALPEDYRQAIILRHLEGFSFAEVAKLMGRSVDSVEKLWVRGLAKLRVSMRDSSCP